jgi:hypothetical protein
MTRSTSALVLIASLAACGGGGPAAPPASAQATAIPAPSAPAAAACPGAYKDAEGRGLACAPQASTSCEYPEGTCQCRTACAGGAPRPPDHPLPTVTVCTPRACGAAVAGGSCSPEGTHCGRCWGPMLDCVKGKWVASSLPPPP